jgi:hypothetical protein
MSRDGNAWHLAIKTLRRPEPVGDGVTSVKEKDHDPAGDVGGMGINRRGNVRVSWGGRTGG